MIAEQWFHFRHNNEEAQEGVFSVITAIESKGVFLQVVLKMLRIHSVMSSSEPSFEVADHSMDPRENLSGPFGFALDLRPVFESVSFQPPVTVPAIRVDLTAVSDIFTDERVKGSLSHIGDDLQPDSTSMIAPVFNGHNHRDLLLSATTSLAFFRSSDVGVIHFNNSLQRLPKRIHHRLTQAPTQIQGCPVRANPQLLHQLQGGDSRSQSAHQVSGPEPITQGQVTSMYYGSSGDISFLATAMAVVRTEAHPPSLSMTAPRTFKSLWPANSNQVSRTGLLCGKPALEFSKSFGKQRIPLFRSFPTHFQRSLTYLHPSSA